MSTASRGSSNRPSRPGQAPSPVRTQSGEAGEQYRIACQQTVEDRKAALQSLDQVAALIRSLAQEQVKPTDSASGSADLGLQRVEERHEAAQRQVHQLQAAIGVLASSKKVELRQSSWSVPPSRHPQ